MALFRYIICTLLTLILLPPALLYGAGGEPLEKRPWEYNLGQGLRILNSDFFLGGYINTEYVDESGEDGLFVLEDLSLFVFGDLSRNLRFFSEFEDQEAIELKIDGDPETNENWQIERLYFDYLYRERLNFRIGKFLTPVGIWNDIHAAPLTWTVSRPAVSIASFPEFITGVQFFGNFSSREDDFSYTFSIQENESISERTSFRNTHRFYGGRIKWFGPAGLEIGMPLLYYNERPMDDDIYLTGLDITIKKPLYEVRLETSYSHVELQNGRDSKEYGYYIQGAYSLTSSLFLIARHDYFNARENIGDHSSISLGSAYKVRPQIIVKLEGQYKSGRLDLKRDSHINNRDRLLASFSVLF